MSKKPKSVDEINEEALVEMLSASIQEGPEIKALETEDDVLTFCIATMTMYLGNMISTFGLCDLAKYEVVHEVLIEYLCNFSISLTRLAHTLNYELPNLKDHREFEEETPYEVVMSPMLSALEMMGAVADIAFEINVNSPNGIWAEEMSDAMEGFFLVLIIGLKNICNRFKISVGDLT